MALWALMWHEENTLDGRTIFIIKEDGLPKIFSTREEARLYALWNYGYIKHRKDLRSEPHGWRMPRAVRVKISIVKEGT